ncbi:hypothetical protein, partial [Peribacillus sp. NPDC096540]|uniref:hypothetical protein n=1 Tax=Peribacillus sp. NPDC096540 TaxID=3390612 RepID=UPI003CFD7E5B
MSSLEVLSSCRSNYIQKRQPFSRTAYSFFCFKMEVLKLEVMRMLSKHDSIQRDQLEMITLDQLVPANHLVR